MAKKRVIKAAGSVRQRDAAKPAEPLSAQCGVAQDDDSGLRWPDEFIPWRSALFMAGAVVVLAALVFGAASLGGFTALKSAWAARLGAGAPELVYSSNFDIATVFWGLGTVVFLGIIHPALGIGAIVLARSWLDGYTFPLDNVYFTWSICALCILWLIRALRGRKPLFIPTPAWMFSALLVYLFLTARYSSQYYNTYQLLWL